MCAHQAWLTRHVESGALEDLLIVGRLSLSHFTDAIDLAVRSRIFAHVGQVVRGGHDLIVRNKNSADGDLVATQCLLCHINCGHEELDVFLPLSGKLRQINSHFAEGN